MPQYGSGANLSFLVSRCLAVKPNAQQSEIVNAINGRIRSIINSRIYWSDLLARRIVAVPNPYTTGTITVTTESSLAVGTATSFPYNDKVNTISALPVQDFGYQEITPASMTNIAIDRMLYCDAAGSQPETVAVVETTPTSFWAKFLYPHNPSFTMTSSSLAGLQLNFGDNYPIFTIRSIHPDGLTAEMDNPWGGPGLSHIPYQALLMYCTIDPFLKVILDIVDQQAGRRLESYVPEEMVNTTDPQRSATGDPLAFVQNTPTEAGTMTYEIWPTPTTARQIYVLCGLQWPDLKLETDRFPWFIDPNLAVIGACADILRINNVRTYLEKDPWFNPPLAMQYEQMFRLQLEEAKNADEAKAQRAYQRNFNELLAAGGANFWQQHDPDLEWGSVWR